MSANWCRVYQNGESTLVQEAVSEQERSSTSNTEL